MAQRDCRDVSGGLGLLLLLRMLLQFGPQATGYSADRAHQHDGHGGTGKEELGEWIFKYALDKHRRHCYTVLRCEEGCKGLLLSVLIIETFYFRLFMDFA